MKNILLSTITGPDQPDILRSLAHETRECGGEWLIAKMIKLDGHFTALMRLTIDTSDEDALKEKLAATFSDLSITYHPITPENGEPHSIVTLEIDCLDRPGLTQDISSLFAQMGIKIAQMESTRHPLGTITSTVFSTRVSLSVPREMSGQMIVDKIEALGGNIDVKSIS